MLPGARDVCRRAGAWGGPPGRRYSARAAAPRPSAAARLSLERLHAAERGLVRAGVVRRSRESVRRLVESPLRSARAVDVARGAARRPPGPAPLRPCQRCHRRLLLRLPRLLHLRAPVLRLRRDVPVLLHGARAQRGAPRLDRPLARDGLLRPGRARDERAGAPALLRRLPDPDTGRARDRDRVRAGVVPAPARRSEPRVPDLFRRSRAAWRGGRRIAARRHAGRLRPDELAPGPRRLARAVGARAGRVLPFLRGARRSTPRRQAPRSGARSEA